MEDYRACEKPPEGWRCSRPKGHAGPCAAIEEALWRSAEAQALETDEVCASLRQQLEGAVDLLEQAVDLIAQPSIPDHARKRWQTAVDELLGGGTAAGGR